MEDSQADAEMGAEGSVSDPALRLQILSTEHWGLLASRALAWNESFSRATMFLAVLSGAVVALALVAQATSFGDGFHVFAVVILPVVLFVGITTIERMGAANYHDAMCVVGMNRIRHAYLEIAPDVEPYLVMSPHDDERGMAVTMAIPPRGVTFMHYMSGAPTIIAVINSIIGGVIAYSTTSLLGLGTAVKVTWTTVGFALVAGLQMWWTTTEIKRSTEGYTPLFPTPVETETPATERG